jgi:phage baseplate assembly protein W
MSGTNRETGAEISVPWEHCAQSIADILTTRIGERVMRRDYGSELLDLIDRPAENDLVLECTMAIGTALDKWEPRFVFKGLGITGPLKGVFGLEAIPDVGKMRNGEFQIDIVGDFYPRGHLGDYTTLESDRGFSVPVSKSAAVLLPVGT